MAKTKKNNEEEIDVNLEDLEVKEKLELITNEKEELEKRYKELETKYNDVKELNTKLYIKLTEKITNEENEDKPEEEETDPDLLSARKKLEEINK